jgi:hypothetical protein
MGFKSLLTSMGVSFKKVGSPSMNNPGAANPLFKTRCSALANEQPARRLLDDLLYILHCA